METRRRLLLNGQLRWGVMLLTQSAWTYGGGWRMWEVNVDW
ncbi:MAG: hypothetical protein ACTS5A_02685 [Candidatus Hodgkinia cicadicola]